MSPIAGLLAYIASAVVAYAALLIAVIGLLHVIGRHR